MTQIQQIPILLPLAVGSVAILCTILIHAMPLGGTLWFVRREKSLGHTGRGFWSDARIVVLVILFAMVAHLIEIALWAVIFLLCGEFADMGTAYYHSAVNFTTLGYGDVLLSPRWRMLGPLEAGNGMLLFGVSTGMVFALILGLAQARFADLRE
jgi:Ion channel